MRAVREELRHQHFEATEGLVRIDADNQHTRKAMRLGRVVEGGQFEVVWSSVKPIRPEPYPRPALWPLGINSLPGFTRSGMGNGPNLRIKVEPNVWAVCRPEVI